VKRHFLTALVLASCGPSQPLQHPTGALAEPTQQAPAGAPASSVASTGPLRLELRALVARGDLQVQDASGWKPLANG
jgi:hypothetical protein